MKSTGGDRVAVDDARGEERRGRDQQEQRGQHHRPVGQAALNNRAGQAGPGDHVRYVLPLASDADIARYTAARGAGSPDRPIERQG